MLAEGVGMAKLIFCGDKFGGRVYEFALEKTTVGRGDHNTLTIHDASVSHSHCEILVYGTEVIVRDLGSSNGTSVNGARFQNQQRPLLAGQIVKFGAVEARLELDSPAVGDTDTATGVTAVHSHARFLRSQQSAPKPNAPVSLSPETGPTTTPSDHTLVLTQSSQATDHTTPVALNSDIAPRNTLRVVMPVLVVAAVSLGLALLCWLILTRDR